MFLTREWLNKPIIVEFGDSPFEYMQGYVYLMVDDLRVRYKIGRTKDVHKRLKQVSQGSPYPIHLLGYVNALDPARLELILHELYKNERVHGEWFELKEEQVKKILDLYIPKTGLSQIEKEYLRFSHPKKGLHGPYIRLKEFVIPTLSLDWEH